MWRTFNRGNAEFVAGSSSYTSGSGLYYSFGAFGSGAVAGTDNYALVESSATNYVVQFDISADGSAVPLAFAWAQGGDPAITLSAAKAAIDAIPAGGGTSAVPEASTSLGLLALGAGGILTRRRQKRAA